MVSIEFDPGQLQLVIPSNFQLNRYHFDILGQCETCQMEEYTDASHCYISLHGWS
ncbi:hypothetical protein D3C75_1267620 [compost metagenome]